MRQITGRAHPTLAIVVACYNEAEVLPLTMPQLIGELDRLIETRAVSPDSRLLLVDDGSSDNTWRIISERAAIDSRVIGISLSRNNGFQRALYAGLMEARSFCDAAVSIDADGQDDERVMEEMLRAHRDGFDVVYGVRANRDSDTASKRGAAQTFYRLMRALGVRTVYNHADYRLMSKRVLDELSRYTEVNLYLRGLIPLIGFPATKVGYERRARRAGSSHYTLAAMVALALDGVTSLTIKPIHLIAAAGAIIAGLSVVGIIWAVAVTLMGMSVPGWSSIVCIVCLIGGLQLAAVGLIGEYIGRIYLETKARPRYAIANRAGDVTLASAPPRRRRRLPPHPRQTHRLLPGRAHRLRVEPCASRSSRS